MAKKASPPRPDPADEKEARQAADLLKLLVEPTRIRILRLLAVEERNVGQLCTALDQTQTDSVCSRLPTGAEWP